MLLFLSEVFEFRRLFSIICGVRCVINRKRKRKMFCVYVAAFVFGFSFVLCLFFSWFLHLFYDTEKTTDPKEPQTIHTHKSTAPWTSAHENMCNAKWNKIKCPFAKRMEQKTQENNWIHFISFQCEKNEKRTNK